MVAMNTEPSSFSYADLTLKDDEQHVNRNNAKEVAWIINVHKRFALFFFCDDQLLLIPVASISMVHSRGR